MRKEVILAIISGGVLGALIAFGIWRANNSSKNTERQAAVTSGSDTNFETAQPISVPRLTLATPANDVVVTESSVAVSGLTQPGNIIIVSGENEDLAQVSSSTGAFETNIDLIGGLNEIKVLAFDKDKKVDETKLKVVYSTEFSRYILSSQELEEAQNSENEDETIRNKVQEKLNQKLSQPKAYIGSITDIAETSVQIKSHTGEIKLLSVTDDGATFVKTTGKANQNVEFADMAIGDYIIAMGFVNENEVLETKRILITNAEASTRNAILSAVTQISANTITLGTELTASKIETGNTVIVSGPVKDGKYQARIVIVISLPSPTPIENNGQ